MAPVISLVMTAYNRERFIASAIESVLAQTRPDFELIVWDDGSADDTVAIARSFAGRDPRVRVIVGEHRGNPASLRDAVVQTTGRYLGWVDSDDLLVNTALAETSAVLDAEPDVGVVYSDYQVMNESGRVVGPGERCQIPYSKDGLLLNYMTFQFRLMRREVYDRVGGIDVGIRWAEDYDLCLKLSEVTPFKHLGRPLYLYRVNSAGVSARNRVDQILSSQQAIANALQRRGLASQYSIEVEIQGKFYLKKR